MPSCSLGQHARRSSGAEPERRARCRATGLNGILLWKKWAVLCKLPSRGVEANCHVADHPCSRLNASFHVLSYITSSSAGRTPATLPHLAQCPTKTLSPLSSSQVMYSAFVMCAHRVRQVGAGPTGLTLALTLLKNGIPVRIIDKAAKYHQEQRGAGIQVSVYSCRSYDGEET